MPAVEKLPQPRAALDENRADAFGCVELVAGKRQQIELQRLHVDGNFARRLHRVRVEINVGFRGDPSDLREWLHRAQFVVGVHHGDQHRFRADRLPQFVQIDQSLAIHREIGDRDALFFQRLAGVQDRFVFDRSGDDVRLARSMVHAMRRRQRFRRSRDCPTPCRRW